MACVYLCVSVCLLQLWKNKHPFSGCCCCSVCISCRPRGVVWLQQFKPVPSRWPVCDVDGAVTGQQGRGWNLALGVLQLGTAACLWHRSQSLVCERPPWTPQQQHHVSCTRCCCSQLQSNLLKWIALRSDYEYPRTHTRTHLTALFPGLPRWASTRKVKPMWILLKQQTVSGSGISWAICKFAPRSRQITMPAPHCSVFYRLDALPAAQPTALKHWTHSECYVYPLRQNIHLSITLCLNDPFKQVVHLIGIDLGRFDCFFVKAANSYAVAVMAVGFWNHFVK